MPFDTLQSAPADVPDGTFEIGLTFAGAVSAGAYHAGFVDFVFEALDEWEARRVSSPATTPNHRTVLRVVGGASAGGMSAALAVHGLATRATWAGPTASNPLYRAWVTDIDIKRLLGVEDVDSSIPHLRSLLDSSVLDTVAASVFPVPHTVVAARPWVARHLHVVLTAGNLRGVPYGVDFGGGKAVRQHGMLLHADHLRFVVDGGPGGAQGGYPVLPTEIRLGTGASAADWLALRNAALASGAFPIGLAPRKLTRPYADYAGRVYGQTASGAHVITPNPIPGMVGGVYDCLAVDGGIMNNEPFDYVGRLLHGPSGAPTASDAVRRAVVMVDPFPEEPELGPHDFWATDATTNERRPETLFSMVSHLFGAWKNQARFKPDEVLAAEDETIYSRFIAVPDRDAGPDTKNLASGMLGGFGGFLHESYRKHDYALGRRNAEWFLREHLALPASHPLFNGWRHNAALYNCYLIPKKVAGDDGPWLPIIPVVWARPGTDVAELNPSPKWPRGIDVLPDLEEPFKQRFNALYDDAIRLAKLGWCVDSVAGLFRGKVRAKAWEAFGDMVRNERLKFKL